jgi:hypothetical protein
MASDSQTRPLFQSSCYRANNSQQAGLAIAAWITHDLVPHRNGGKNVRLVAFDLEIANELPDGARDWRRIGPLGITCAAAQGDSHSLSFWQGRPRMTPAQCRELVQDLTQMVSAGHTLVTWNGCGFDFAVLAQESGMVAECAELALYHIDMMLMVTFSQGFFLGLQKALLGAGLEGKRQVVTLSDGRIVKGMEGRLAPHLWKQGEYDAVLSYLEADVENTLALARHVQQEQVIRWTSGRGRLQAVHFDRLLTVRECFELPEPDVSWMTNPPRRRQFISWIPDHLTASLLG